jgi:hypothetical protein
MRTSKYITLGLTIALIGLSLFNVFEKSAHEFATDVLNKNLSFLAAIEEIKLIFGGLSSLQVPFLSGHSEIISNSINKPEKLLLNTSIISAVQVMILSISKGWIIKSFIVILFALTLIDRIEKHAKKFLFLALALSPGLSIFTIIVKEVSHASAIDFGSKYLIELKQTVNGIRKEKNQLMVEHEQAVVRIENGERGIKFFKKLKEDISYDFKKTKAEVHGTYSHIRLLIHDAGYELTSKIYSFCSMVIFSMLLLPIGYVIILFILYGTLFQGDRIDDLIHNGIEKSGIIGLLSEVKNRAVSLNESYSSPSISSIPKSSPLTDRSDGNENTKNDVNTNSDKGFISKVQHSVSEEFDQIKSHLEDELKSHSDILENTKREFEDLRNKLIFSVREKSQTTFTQLKDFIKNEITESDRIFDESKGGLEMLKNEISSSVKERMEKDYLNLKTKLQNEIQINADKLFDDVLKSLETEKTEHETSLNKIRSAVELNYSGPLKTFLTKLEDDNKNLKTASGIPSVPDPNASNIESNKVATIPEKKPNFILSM